MRHAVQLLWKALEMSVIGLSALVLIGAGVVVVKSRIAPTRSEAAESPEFQRAVEDVEALHSFGHATGPAVANHTVVVFSDFECPACRAFSFVIDTLRERYPDLRVIERHWPLTSLHPFAFKAALAAECATDVGAYKEVRRALFARPALIEAEEWGLLGRVAAVNDTARFASCVRSERLKANVQRDADFAAKHGFLGTPTVLLDGRRFSETPTLSDVEQEIAIGRGSHR